LDELDAPAPGGRSSRIGIVLLLAGLAVQMCLAAIVLVDPPALDQAELSQWGGFALHPEREAPLYLATLGAALVVFAALSLWLERRTSHRTGGSFLLSPGVQGAVAIGATAAFVALLARLRDTPAGQAHPGGQVAALAAPFLVALLFLAASVWLSPGAVSGKPAEFDSGAPDRLRFSPWDLIVPVAVFLLLWVPEGTIPAGRMFLEENNIHWDLFAMAQALMFRHGQALGTDTYSYYGAGWPLVFAGLAEWVPLTYGRMIQIGSAYLVVYMCGIYLFFRVLVRRPVQAVAGTVLVLLPCFYWLYGLYFWRSPNVTPMRWAFDVWVLLALVVHARTSGRAWAVAAGVFTGLAVVFNINGGLELATAVGFYFLGGLMLKRPGAGRDFATAGLASLTLVVAGLALAGRGQVFSLEFWTGWLKEPLGFSSLPLLTGVTPAALFWFAALVFGYLLAAGWAISRATRRAATMLDWLAGAIGVYGLMLLVKFVRYSSDQTLYRLLTPATILLVFFAARAWERRRFDIGLPVKIGGLAVAAVAVAAAVFSGPKLVDPVLDYPNLVAQWSRGADPEGVCLLTEPRDLCGLPAGFEQPAGQIQAISAQLSDLKSQGKSFAVIDENGSLFNLATDTGPFFRQPRIFFSTIAKDRVEAITEELDSDPPDYMLTRLPLVEGTPDYQAWSLMGIGPTENSFYGDLWGSLQQVVESRYQLESTMEPYQLWRLK
jgi:hypothetical protein